MSGRPSEESGTSDLMCFTREVPMPIVRSGDLGKAIIPSKLVRVLVRPTTMHAHVHVRPHPPRPPRGGALKSSQVAAAKARRPSGRPWPPIGARQPAWVAAGWARVGPVGWSTATSPLMRCLPGVRT